MYGCKTIIIFLMNSTIKDVEKQENKETFMGSHINIIAFIKSKILYNRIEGSFTQDNNIHLIECSCLNDCAIKIEKLSSGISCIIIDDEGDENDVLNSITKIRAFATQKIPVLLISSGNKLPFFSH